MPQHSQHRVGVSLVIVSAIVFSSAGIFTRGVETAAWDIIFWRGVFAAGFTLSFQALRGSLGAEARALKGPGLLAALLMGIGTAAFIPAFKLSSVANVAMIYAAAPFIAAALSWVAIKEAPSKSVIIAASVAFGGVFVILSGSLGAGHLGGDLLALLMTLMMASTMVIYRRFPETPAALPAALSSIILLPVALFLGAPFDVPLAELPVLIAFGLVFATASVTLSEGARRLPSAETALLSILEMPLAPLLAFLVLSEVPTSQTLLGGAIILAAILWSQRQT